MLRKTLPSLLAALVLTGFSAPAFAAFTSAYSDIDLDQCLVLDADDFGASWSCPGYKGYPLKIFEGDLRFTLSYGFNIDQEPDAQTLPPFNRLGPQMEWRLSNALGRWMPVATIVRYFTQDPDDAQKTGQVLVVTQIVKGQTCHIAYVDALANPDAEALARAAADASGSFDCATDSIDYPGKFEAW